MCQTAYLFIYYIRGQTLYNYPFITAYNVFVAQAFDLLSCSFAILVYLDFIFNGNKVK